MNGRSDIDLFADREELGVPGLSAAIVKNGRVVATPVAGTADARQGRQVTPETVFTWASVSKTVTATALMQLFDEKLFALDDDIGPHLGFDVRIPACPREPVTFRHLLTHTSGIRDSKIYDSLYVEGDSPVGLGEFITGYLTVAGKYYHPRNFRKCCPGTVYDYSNIGAGVVGRLVEVISGVPFDRRVADAVCAPLGMVDTSFRLADLDRSIPALPGGDGPPQGFPTFPDGTLRSPPRELAKFLIAYTLGGTYCGRKVLKRTTVRTMLRNQSKVTSGQGLMWYTKKIAGNCMWGHDGDDPGISSAMFFDPRTAIGVLLAANGEWRHGARKTMRKLVHCARSY